MADETDSQEEQPWAPGWENRTGLLGVDDPAMVDAAFERGEPHVGCAVIGLALNHPDPEAILPRVARALRADDPARQSQGTVALAHVARLHHTVDQECLDLVRTRSRGNDLWSFVPRRRLPWWIWRHQLPGQPQVAPLRALAPLTPESNGRSALLFTLRVDP